MDNVTRETPNEEQMLYAVAIRFYQGRDFNSAKTVAKNLTYRDPTEPKYYQLLGNVLQALGDYKTAIVAYRQAFFVSGGTGAIAISATQCAIALEDWNLARQWFETALTLDPKDPMISKLEAVLKRH